MNFSCGRRLRSFVVPGVVLWGVLCVAGGGLPAGAAQSTQEGEKPAVSPGGDVTTDASAQRKEQTPEQKLVENYLRHLYGWSRDKVEVNIGSPESSSIPSLRQVTVEATSGGGVHREVVYLSPDGRHIFRGQLHDLNQDPFLPIRQQIDLQGQPSQGPAQAPVTVVEYSDFQCQYCKQMSDVLRKQLPEAYGETVRLVFKDFPLAGVHPWATRAAVAGRAIYRLQPSLFWEYHDWIFENQETITVENLPAKVLEFVAEKGLDADKLQETMDAPDIEMEVTRSFQEGRNLGVQSTPTLFINGRRLVGSQPFERLKILLDWELERSRTAATE